MALFSIKQNTDEARVVTSGVDLGSAFKVCVATDRLGERADQSSWPQAVKDEDGRYVCARGLYNIIRAACEFALEELRCCDVYLGSPSEIAATLYAQASSRLDTSRLLFIDDECELPVIDRLGLASDAEDFIRICSGLGFEMSERTAHRILSGEDSARSWRDRAPAVRSVIPPRMRRLPSILPRTVEAFVSPRMIWRSFRVRSSVTLTTSLPGITSICAATLRFAFRVIASR